MKNLITELNKMGFTETELEKAVGTNVNNVVFTKVKNLGKPEWEELLVVKKADLVCLEGPLGFGSVIIPRKVFVVGPEVKSKNGFYREKGIIEEPGVKTYEDEMLVSTNTEAYIWNRKKDIIEKKYNLRKPDKMLEEKFSEFGVKYFRIKCSGEEEEV